MKVVLKILPWLNTLMIVLMVSVPAAAQQMRDISQPMQIVVDYQKERLIGQWYEVARSPSRFEIDCHGVSANVETRDDSRLTLKIVCHKGAVSGPILHIDSILVEIEPAIFVMRFVRLRGFGDQTLVVLWQAEDESLAVLGSPDGQFGWVWSKTADVDDATLALGREKLIASGYNGQNIRAVKHK